MAEQVPFINREEELEQIEALIGEWGTRRVLCIHGPGGIGKTRLLQEVRKRYADSEETSRLRVLDIIDFDDRNFHIPQNVGRRIAAVLSEEAFEPYIRGLLDWRRMEMAGVSPEGLEQQSKRVSQILVDNFNEVSSKWRVVLPMDTTDALEGTDTWNYMGNLAAQMENVLFLVAGRNAKVLWEELKSKIGEDARLLELPPLETEASEQYLQQKQKLLHVTLAPEIAQKLLLLAQGRPILIDLAVEWTAREIPLDWLVEESLTQLKGLSAEEMKKRQKEFEYQLVHHIASIRTQMDRLILALSRVYPLDREMIVELLGLSEDEAEELLEEARTYTYVFIKSLPDGRIALHDEMRRMVNQYVWPETDPQGDRQRRDSKQAAAYLERKLKTLREQIEQLERVEKAAREEQDAKKELEAFLEREALERELWVLEGRRLRHILFDDLDKGVRTFAEIFDEATQAYRYAFRKTLLEQVQKHVDGLSPEQKYEVDIRQAKYLLDSGQYPEARDLLVRISGRTGLRPDQQIDTCIQLANVEIRLGKFQDGIRLFQEAVQISKEHGLREWLAKAETGLGWAYRLVHDRRKAGEHYEVALDLAIEIGAKHQQALLYNNLGFVYAYYAHIRGNKEKALWFCNQALSIWKELDYKRAIGQAYSTLGCITYMAGRFDEALSCFRKALDIFEPAHDHEWLSTVYSWRGALHMWMGRFDLAEKDLLRSLEMNVRKDRPINLSRIGRLYMHLHKLDEAQKTMEKCHKLALALPDVLYQLISLRDLARVALLKGEYERLEEFKQLLDDHWKEWGEPQDSRALGMLYLNLGSLALGKSDLTQAAEYFKLGLRCLAQLDRYAGDTLQAQVERLEKVLVKNLYLAPEQIRDIGARLLSLWQEEGLDVIHPDVRILLSKWAKWEGA